MRLKKLLPIILMVLLDVALISAVVIFGGIIKKPTVTENVFEFSVTYEYNGKTETLNENYACSFDYADSSYGSENRVWRGGIVRYGADTQTNNITVERADDSQILIITNLCSGYLMGDPLYDDYYESEEDSEPYIAYYNELGEELSDKETLDSKGIKLISWEYPERIENSFVFSHIAPLNGDLVIPMLLFAALMLVAVIVFIKKEKELIYTSVDKVSVVLNYLIAIICLPFFTVAGVLYDVNGDGRSYDAQIMYALPAFTVICLAVSIFLRKRGYSKSSVAVQLLAPVVFALVYVIEMISMCT